MRVSKKPEERKLEITQAALELFMEKGYKNVSVKDITTKVNVAVGLFHYYFHSKEDVLMECVRLDRQKFLDEINAEGYFPTEMNAVEKINRLVSVAMRNITERTQLIKEAQDINDAMLIHQIRDYVFGVISDKLTEFIIQGNDEGTFACKYPQATSEIALFGLSHYFSREQERNPALKQLLFGEYIYVDSDKIISIMMGLLNMKEQNGLFEFGKDKEKA
ncbi:TetR/AcrR family transcriptional regulator [Anaerotignum sp.]|uniref:TetR/AcrR family transcriptional regulator n=1 Tax=Anaerotignum sp. TaxID=2039241 RepID=UPI002715457C|nr:TetR/AcrR family transcriptional regulator [Anaerotignum sp.]